MPILTRRETTGFPVEKKKRRTVGEITTAWAQSWGGGLRASFRNFTRTFWPTPPAYAGTKISYDKARKLYRNDDKAANLGSGFCRRIVNATPDFIELPRSSTGDEVVDQFLDKAIHDYWPAELMQMFRDACRDADTVVRIRRHNPDNPLISAEEWEMCYLEIIPPERVAIYYKEDGKGKEIDVAYVRHEVEMVIERATDTGASLRAPQTREHVIIEQITSEDFTYYDETAGKWIPEWAQPNSWGFAPLVEVHNEFDAALEGGQSDFEAPLPFILAFHDVLGQTLQAHKAHAIPKARFKVNDLMTFMANNWPESFDRDENGQVIGGTFNGQVSWKGTEILFMSPDEDVDFLEAQSVLGDSKTLLDFLLQCISIASETPKTTLMDQTAQDADEMIPLSKKINRKRKFFQPYIQEICKMVLAINHMEPLRVPLTWEEITPDMVVKKAQALQQTVMATEVLATRQVISDRTVREHVRPQLPSMKSSTQEATDAKKNVPIPGAAGAVSDGSVKGTDAGNKKVGAAQE